MTTNKINRATSIVVDSSASFPSDILQSTHEGLYIVLSLIHI